MTSVTGPVSDPEKVEVAPSALVRSWVAEAKLMVPVPRWATLRDGSGVAMSRIRR